MTQNAAQLNLFQENQSGPAQISQDEINAILWRACDTFRGVVDPSEYKNYILVMLFIKYISDVWQDHYDRYSREYGGDEERIRRRMRYERFVLPPGCSFADLYEQRNAPNLGEIINIALEKIEEENKEKLSGVFRNIDFNSEANLGRTRQRNERLKNLLDDFADRRLDLTIRQMKNRWGSCTPEGKIILNLKLIQVPKAYIDYVIMHELCHLKEHNHSRRFYDLLDRVMPDWQSKRAKLNTFEIS